jgi:hypothetical protein
MILCDLRGQARECLQKEIGGRVFDICADCWRPLQEKLSGKGRVKKEREMILPKTRITSWLALNSCRLLRARSASTALSVFIATAAKNCKRYPAFIALSQTTAFRELRSPHTASKFSRVAPLSEPRPG